MFVYELVPKLESVLELPLVASSVAGRARVDAAVGEGVDRRCPPAPPSPQSGRLLHPFLGHLFIEYCNGLIMLFLL